MHSRKTAMAWLLEKDARELVASRSWWVLLVTIGPLVGVSFVSAVRTYAEASGLNGTSGGVGEAFSPLVGVLAPTFSACELAAAFLLPFVAIRLVSGDRQSGALKLELQHPLPPTARVAATALVLLAAWMLVLGAPLLAVLLWRSYGGIVYPPELAALLLGHVLNAGLSVALAAATASVTEHPSTAAILTLTVTVGTWVLAFVAAVQGGVWDRAVAYTPTAVVAAFQHGLVSLDVVLVTLVLIASGLVLAAVWMRLGVAIKRRVSESFVVGAVATALIVASTFVTPSWDLSENRMNSFSESDEDTLRHIRGPLRIEAHLAPEDPRRADLEHRALSKLRRAMPAVQVQYVSATTIGLFEQTAPHYGEIWYDLNGKRAMSRATTAEGVLETIYGLAGIQAPAETDEPFRGHPLATPPKGAGAVFFVIWPALVAAAALAARRVEGRSSKR